MGRGAGNFPGPIRLRLRVAAPAPPSTNQPEIEALALAEQQVSGFCRIRVDDDLQVIPSPGGMVNNDEVPSWR